MFDVVILAAAFEALRLPQQRPTTGFVARAAEELRVDETLGHQHLMAIGLEPVRRHPLEAAFHDTTGQIGNAGLRQDGKAAIVHHQGESALLLLGVHPIQVSRSRKLKAAAFHVSKALHCPAYPRRSAVARRPARRCEGSAL